MKDRGGLIKAPVGRYWLSYLFLCDMPPHHLGAQNNSSLFSPANLWVDRAQPGNPVAGLGARLV